MKSLKSERPTELVHLNVFYFGSAWLCSQRQVRHRNRILCVIEYALCCEMWVNWKLREFIYFVSFSLMTLNIMGVLCALKTMKCFQHELCLWLCRQNWCWWRTCCLLLLLLIKISSWIPPAWDITCNLMDCWIYSKRIGVVKVCAWMWLRANRLYKTICTTPSNRQTLICFNTLSPER